MQASEYGDEADPAASGLRDAFMAWQCLIRQHAMRRDAGRPSDGMAPLAVLAGGEELGHVRTVILEREPEASTAILRHAVRSTHDPRERFEKGLKFLSATYYQKSRNFEPRLFSQFARQSPGAASLIAAGRCMLRFHQFSQTWRLPCHIAELPSGDPFAEALRWHNALFAPPPIAPRPLAFNPVWAEVEADPPLERG